MKQHAKDQEICGVEAAHQICNQGVGGSSPSAGTSLSATSTATASKSPTGSPTSYYLEPWGRSWRIVDLKRGWGFQDSVCTCSSRDDALMILDLLQGGRR